MATEGGKQFTQILNELRGGLVQSELTRDLRELIEAIQESGRGGSLTLTLKFKPHGARNREVHVTAAHTIKKPPKPDMDGASIFFAQRGNLLRDDPEQGDFFRGPRGVRDERADGSSPAEQAATGSGME